MAGNSICHLLVRVKDLSPSYPSTSNHNDNSNYHKNTALSLFYIKPQLLVVAYITKDIVFYLFSTSNHNVYFITCLFISICYTYVIHEVANFDAFLCKITKKILSVMGLAWIFSPRIPIYE